MHREGTHVIRRAQGSTLYDEEGRELLDATRGSLVRQRRLRAHRDRGCGRGADARGRVLPVVLQHHHRTGDPALGETRRARAAAAPAQHLLELGLGGERDRAEADPCLLEAARPAREDEGAVAHLRVSRRRHRDDQPHRTRDAARIPSTCRCPASCTCRAPTRTAAARATRNTAPGVSPRPRRRSSARARHTIAAFFAEPVQGAGGVIVPPDGHLAALRDLCRRHEILFVADEVITGFGRLGAWFASVLWDLEPDLMTVAKGITSGYLPLGATMVSDEIADTLEAGGYLAHGFTYTGHPATCAAGAREPRDPRAREPRRARARRRRPALPGGAAQARPITRSSPKCAASD